MLYSHMRSRARWDLPLQNSFDPQLDCYQCKFGFIDGAVYKVFDV